MVSLQSFLYRSAHREFRYGEHDCLLWLADWVLERHGADPADGLRGSYSGKLGAARLLLRHGGMRPLVASCVAPMGIRHTDAPRVGDIAVVEAGGEVGAIVLGERVATLGRDGGVVVFRVPVLACWSL